jgi:hypothetical protein
MHQNRDGVQLYPDRRLRYRSHPSQRRECGGLDRLTRCPHAQERGTHPEAHPRPILRLIAFGPERSRKPARRQTPRQRSPSTI